MLNKDNYAEAWKEIKICRKAKMSIDPAMIKQLSEKMPEPK
jgi:hypothetical protein